MLTTGLLLLFETAFVYLLHILEDYQVAFQYTFLTFSKQIILHFWTKSKHFRCKFKLFHLSCSLACSFRLDLGSLFLLRGTSCLLTSLFLYGIYLFINIFSGVHAQFCNRGWINGHYKKLGDVGQKIGQNVQIDCKLLNLSGFLVVCSGHSVIKFYLSSELF